MSLFNTFGEKVRETGENITNYGAYALSLVRWYYIIPVLVCQLQNDYLLIVSKSFSEIITNVLHRLDLPHTRIIVISTHILRMEDDCILL